MNWKTVAAAIGIASFVAGSATGFFTAKRLLEKKYEELLKQEIEYTKKFYARQAKKDGFESPIEAAKALLPEEAADALLKYQTAVVTDYHAISKGGEQIVRNIFAETSSVDLEKEIAARTEEAPYIISVREYSENELDHQQATLTYYAGDQVLADEKDENIPNTDETVGDNNLPRFGHRSEDPNTLFVRNEALEMDFEIVLKQGKYKEIVLGMTD